MQNSSQQCINKQKLWPINLRRKNVRDYFFPINPWSTFFVVDKNSVKLWHDHWPRLVLHELSIQVVYCPVNHKGKGKHTPLFHDLKCCPTNKTINYDLEMIIISSFDRWMFALLYGGGGSGGGATAARWWRSWWHCRWWTCDISLIGHIYATVSSLT